MVRKSNLDTLYFLICPNYHGSTIISLLLNNHSKIITLGDMIPFKRYFTESRKCTCGKPSMNCEYWKYITKKMGYNFHDEFFLEVLPKLLPWYRVNKYIIFVLTQLCLKNKNQCKYFKTEKYKKYVEKYIYYYRQNLSYFKKELFVDTRKNILRILPFYFNSNKEIRIIHLIRDPRAYIYSVIKHKKDVNIWVECKKYVLYHKLIHKMRALPRIHVLTIWHEQFCENPIEIMREIFEFLGVEYENVFRPFDDIRNVHIIGNVKAIAAFDGTVRYDDSWKSFFNEKMQQKILEYTKSVTGLFR